MRLLFLIILAFLLCFSAPAQTEDCQAKQDIKMQYGEPFWKGEGTAREVWYYPHKRMFVFFEGDKAVEIDVVKGRRYE